MFRPVQWGQRWRRPAILLTLAVLAELAAWKMLSIFSMGARVRLSPGTLPITLKGSGSLSMLDQIVDDGQIVGIRGGVIDVKFQATSPRIQGLAYGGSLGLRSTGRPPD